MSVQRPYRGAAWGVAAGGVLLGHWFTYRVTAPDAHLRAAELSATGHSYLGVLNDAGLILSLIGVAAIFLGRLTDAGRPTPGLRSLVTRLAAFQVLAFAAMELIERWTSGAPIGGAMHHGVLQVGIPIQLVVAVIAAVAIRWLLRAAARLEAILGAAAALPRSVTSPLVPHRQVWPARPVLATAGIRGPPARS